MFDLNVIMQILKYCLIWQNAPVPAPAINLPQLPRLISRLEIFIALNKTWALCKR